MSKTLAFLGAGAVAAGAYFGSPMLGEDFSQVWFIGTGNWNNVFLHGRDLLAAGLGATTWLFGLHYAR